MAARKSKRASLRARRHTPARSESHTLTNCLDQLDVILATTRTLEQALDAETDSEPFAVVTLQHVILPLEAISKSLAALRRTEGAR